METRKDEEDLLIEAIGKFGYAERHDQGASGKEMENARPRFQEASAAVPMSALKQRVYTVISEASKAALTPCSSQAEPSVLSAAGSPASLDIDLAHNKANLWHESNDSFPSEKAQGSKGELLMEGMKKLEYLDKYLQVFEKETLESRLQAAAEARRHDKEVVRKRTTSNTTQSPRGRSSSAVTPTLRPVTVHQWPQSKHRPLPTETPKDEEEWPDGTGISKNESKTGLSLAKNRGGEEKWPSQDIISKTRADTNQYSPESVVALTSPATKLVSPQLVYCLPSPDPKTWLRRKPPDHGKPKSYKR
jgi:hypothetical protein